jgi:hypothetical protein
MSISSKISTLGINNNNIIENNNHNKEIEYYNIYKNNNKVNGIYRYINGKREILQKGEIDYKYINNIKYKKRFKSPIRIQYLNNEKEDKIDLNFNNDKRLINELNNEYNRAFFNILDKEINKPNTNINNIEDLALCIPEQLNNIYNNNNKYNNFNDILNNTNIYKMTKIIDKHKYQKPNNYIYTYTLPSKRNRYKISPKKHIYTHDEIQYNNSLYPISNHINEIIM